MGIQSAIADYTISFPQEAQHEKNKWMENSVHRIFYSKVSQLWRRERQALLKIDPTPASFSFIIGLFKHTSLQFFNE